MPVALNFSKYSLSTIRGLGVAKLQGLTSADLAKNDASGPSVLSDLLPSQISALNPRALTLSLIKSMIDAQILGFNYVQLISIIANGTTLLSLLNSRQVQQFGTLNLDKLTHKDVIIKDINGKAILSDLTSAQSKSLSASLVASFTSVDLSTINASGRPILLDLAVG